MEDERNRIEIALARIGTPVVWLTVGGLFLTFGFFDEMLAAFLRQRALVDAHVVTMRAHATLCSGCLALGVALWRWHAARRAH